MVDLPSSTGTVPIGVDPIVGPRELLPATGALSSSIIENLVEAILRIGCHRSLGSVAPCLRVTSLPVRGWPSHPLGLPSRIPEGFQQVDPGVGIISGRVCSFGKRPLCVPAQPRRITPSRESKIVRKVRGTVLNDRPDANLG